MNFYKKKLVHIRNKFFLQKTFENLLLFIGIILILFLSYTFVSNFFIDNYDTLSTICLIFKIIIILITLYIIFRIATSYHSIKYIAGNLTDIDAKQNEILFSALELEDNLENKPFYSSEITNAAIEKANEIAKHIRFSNNFSPKPFFNSVKIFIIITVISASYGIIFPSQIRMAYKSLANIKNFKPQYDSHIELSPGNTVILKGDNQKIEIKNYYADLQYKFSYIKNLRTKTVNLDKPYYLLYNIDDSIQYFAENQYASSDTFCIEVLEKPAINNLTIYYDFPDYTKLPDKIEEDASGNIFALKGTKLKFVLKTNNQVSKARIIFSDGETKELKNLVEKKLYLDFIVKKSTSYHFYLKDILGNKNRFIERTIYAEDDLPPQIEITSPAEDRILAQNLKQEISYNASDDFGISELQIIYKKNKQEYIHKTISQKTDINRTNLKQNYIFDLNDQQLLPGDVIMYYLKVFETVQFPKNNLPNREFTF